MAFPINIRHGRGPGNKSSYSQRRPTALAGNIAAKRSYKCCILLTRQSALTLKAGASYRTGGKHLKEGSSWCCGSNCSLNQLYTAVKSFIANVPKCIAGVKTKFKSHAALQID